MKSYQKINNIVGWLVFAIAATVYLMTIEPTASFWDCGEFIISAFKLEVGHPPGAPFFMLTGNLFTQLTGGDVTNVAMMANALSAICSALTILFLFWSITHIARRVLANKDEALTLAQTIVIMASGAVGALVYTFSDTFWFSAVEGEVYAFSSLFTALVFWLILKWESKADLPHSDKWLVLIAYFMGLSIGVHLLNLLCIPAMVLVYYFKKFPDPTTKGTIYALLISFAVVGLMLYGFVQGLVEVCGWFELLCVNILGMPYNSGVIVYLILVSGTLLWGLYESSRVQNRPLFMKIAFLLSVTLLGLPFIGEGIWIGLVLIAALGVFLFRKKNISVRILNTALAAMFVILIGYSSYATILIRSSANPPMDQNAPEDIFTLATYLGREQYGQRPLFYGQTYASEMQREVSGDACTLVRKQGAPIWKREVKADASKKDKYVVSGYKEEVVFAPEFDMLFPRMYSGDNSNHVEAYKDWARIKGKPQRFNRCGEMVTITKPTFVENMRFFFSYQLNFMYWRYFMWNFSGRQNDLQSYGEVHKGNWITGIPFIDELMVGPQTDMPSSIVNNKGHNKYYMLPLLLGLIGLFYQLYAGKKGVQSFWITFLLFFMTGIAIVIYLNQTPYQPRERDYAYAGSFYAFSIWVGFGVVGLWQLLQKYLKTNPLVSAAAVSALCLLVPIQMAGQTWDDHDRSNRYACRDFGKNYLESCEPNGIIFTYGDNDTFPLWYAQEVEGFRTDVRVCNLSYLQTEWYIDQMKRQAYDSEPLPISWTKMQYQQGAKEHAFVIDRTKRPLLLSEAMAFVKSDEPRTKLPGMDNMDYFPSGHLVLPINKEDVLRKGVVSAADSSSIVAQIDIDISGKTAVWKHEMMILDMLLTNNWNRPVYYATSVGDDNYLKLQSYFRLTGFAQQIVPVNTAESQTDINTEKMYDNMMNKFKWGNIADPKVYLDETIMRMCHSARILFVQLVEALIKEGKTDKALAALDYSLEVIPPEQVPFNSIALSMGEQYFQLGQDAKARLIFERLGDDALRNLNWFFRLPEYQATSVRSDIQHNLAILQHIVTMCDEYDLDLGSKYETAFKELVQGLERMIR